MIYSHPNVDLEKQLPEKGQSPLLGQGLYLPCNETFFQFLLTIPEIDINAHVKDTFPLEAALQKNESYAQILLNDPRLIITSDVIFLFLILRKLRITKMRASIWN